MSSRRKSRSENSSQQRVALTPPDGGRRPDGGLKSAGRRGGAIAKIGLPLLVVAAALLATIDDRHVGREADERQIIWTAIALSETGQWAQARDRDFTFVARDGRAVSRFGIGMSVLQVPAAWLAPAVERAIGRPGSSQPLFLVMPVLLVLASAGTAGLASRLLGGTAAPAILLAGLGSPLGAYAATGSSEPLQAFALVGAFTAALMAAGSIDIGRATRRALVAGALAGVALAAKSSLLAVSPFALLPLVAPGKRPDLRLRRAAWALAGFLPVGAIWSAVEWARFGSLFGSYPGEAFNHPLVDGCWRLLVGPNFGIVLFFPAILAVPWRVAAPIRAHRWNEVFATAGAVVPFLGLLALAGSWWAWHGAWGWGPRLLVPAIPSLAAVASAAMARRPAWSRGALIVTSIAINAPGLLQHSTPVASYVSNLSWPSAPQAFAQSLAGYAARRDADGTYRVSPDHVLSVVPSASALRVYPWFFWATWSDDTSRSERLLSSPPWRAARPDLTPVENPMGESLLRYITGPPRARFWGRGFVPSSDDAAYASVFDEGLADQVVRLQQLGNGAAALALARRLVGLAPVGDYDALVLESYRLLRNRPLAAQYLTGLPLERRASPALNVVLALFERDGGNEEAARQLLESVAEQFPADTPLRAALAAPLSAWPPDLQAMIAKRVNAAGE